LTLTAASAIVSGQSYAVVACHLETGAIVGSNFLDQRDEAASVGRAHYHESVVGID
jgi:hypothetical protein